jgi:hypothetical protein
VTFTDALPAGTTRFGASSSQGTCTGTTNISCSLGTLDSSATGASSSATVTVILIPSVAGTVTNTAEVTAREADSNPADNSAAATTHVSAPSSAGPGTNTLVLVPGAKVAVAPVVLTGPASKLTSSQARLSGIVDPAGATTTYRFQLGKTKRYGTTTKSPSLVAGTTGRPVTLTVKGLKAGTTYHFRLAASNKAGSMNGQDVTFKTAKAKKPKKKKKKKKK